jgi:hypothetical protein
MNTAGRCPQLLIGPNPFRVNAPASLFDAPSFDVPEVGGTTRRELMRLVDLSSRDPARRSRGFLLLGEPEGGRTHALAGLLRSGLADRAFVATVPMAGSRGPACGATQAARVAGGLLEGLARTLPGADRSQLDQLLDAALEAIAEDPRQAPSPLEARRLARALCERYPELDRRPVRTLLAARAPAVRAQVMAWLRSEETDPNVFKQWLGGARPLTDDAALRLLAAAARLGLLSQPIVLVLDGVETMLRGDQPPYPAARSLIATLCLLHDTTRGLLIVTTCTTSAWVERLAPRLLSSELARAVSRIIEIPALEPEDAVALVAARILGHLGENAADALPYPSFPFHPDLLEAACPVPAGDLLEVCAREIDRMRAAGRVLEVTALA